MFHLQNVTKTYSRRSKEVRAFAAEALTIPSGDYVAVVGPSGSGKTTFLSMLGGMLSPDSGRIWLEGVSLYELSLSDRTRMRRDRIGFVFQTFNLIPYLTAIENVQIPLYLAGCDVQEQRRTAGTLLERMGLGERLDHKPSELSIGQQQRVALARTLANNPAVILADEPTGNLDSENRMLVLDFFGDLHREGRTIVMVTHDEVAADRACRRLTLKCGEVSPMSASCAA